MCCNVHRAAIAPTAAPWVLLMFVIMGANLAGAAARDVPRESPSTLPARPTPVVSLAFTANGMELFVARQDGVEARDVGNGQRQMLDFKLARVSAIATGAGDRLFAVAGGTPGEAGVVIVWDRKSDQRLAIDGLADLATAVAFSSDGTLLAAASADRTCKLFRLVEKDKRWQAEPAGTLVGHGGPVTSVVFSPDGKFVATASVDRSIKVWTVAGVLLRTLGNHTDAVNALAVRPSVTADAPWTIASASDDRTVRIWQPGIGRMVRIVRGHDGPVLAIAYAADGKTMVSVGAEGRLRVIEADGDKILQSTSAHDDWSYALAVSPADGDIATGDWAGAVAVWRIGKAGLKRAR